MSAIQEKKSNPTATTYSNVPGYDPNQPANSAQNRTAIGNYQAGRPTTKPSAVPSAPAPRPTQPATPSKGSGSGSTVIPKSAVTPQEEPTITVSSTVLAKSDQLRKEEGEQPLEKTIPLEVITYKTTPTIKVSESVLSKSDQLRKQEGEPPLEKTISLEVFSYRPVQEPTLSVSSTVLAKSDQLRKQEGDKPLEQTLPLEVITYKTDTRTPLEISSTVLSKSDQLRKSEGDKPLEQTLPLEVITYKQSESQGVTSSKTEYVQSDKLKQGVGAYLAPFAFIGLSVISAGKQAVDVLTGKYKPGERTKEEQQVNLQVEKTFGTAASDPLSTLTGSESLETKVATGVGAGVGFAVGLIGGAKEVTPGAKVGNVNEIINAVKSVEEMEPISQRTVTTSKPVGKITTFEQVGIQKTEINVNPEIAKLEPVVIRESETFTKVASEKVKTTSGKEIEAPTFEKTGGTVKAQVPQPPKATLQEPKVGMGQTGEKYVVYHGTKESSARDILEKGFNKEQTGIAEYAGSQRPKDITAFTTPSRNLAEEYAKKNLEITGEEPALLKITLSSESKIINIKDIPETVKASGNFEDIVSYAKAKGYDVLQTGNTGRVGNYETEILNPNIIKNIEPISLINKEEQIGFQSDELGKEVHGLKEIKTTPEFGKITIEQPPKATLTQPEAIGEPKIPVTIVSKNAVAYFTGPSSKIIPSDVLATEITLKQASELGFTKAEGLVRSYRGQLTEEVLKKMEKMKLADVGLQFTESTSEASKVAKPLAFEIAQGEKLGKFSGLRPAVTRIVTGGGRYELKRTEEQPEKLPDDIFKEDTAKAKGEIGPHFPKQTMEEIQNRYPLKSVKEELIPDILSKMTGTTTEPVKETPAISSPLGLFSKQEETPSSSRLVKEETETISLRTPSDFERPTMTLVNKTSLENIVSAKELTLSIPKKDIGVDKLTNQVSGLISTTKEKTDLETDQNVSTVQQTGLISLTRQTQSTEQVTKQQTKQVTQLVSETTLETPPPNKTETTFTPGPTPPLPDKFDKLFEKRKRGKSKKTQEFTGNAPLTSVVGLTKGQEIVYGKAASKRASESFRSTKKNELVLGQNKSVKIINPQGNKFSKEPKRKMKF